MSSMLSAPTTIPATSDVAFTAASAARGRVWWATPGHAVLAAVIACAYAGFFHAVGEERLLAWDCSED